MGDVSRVAPVGQPRFEREAVAARYVLGNKRALPRRQLGTTASPCHRWVLINWSWVGGFAYSNICFDQEMGFFTCLGF